MTSSMARALRWTDIKREGRCLTIIKPLCQPDTTVAHAAVMAAAQRPYAAAAFAAAPSGPLAWKTLPCWYLLGTQDKAIPPALQRFMAERANATIVEVRASHVGGLFVIITLSVVIQVGSYKLTRKRVFRMAPLQHHFELAGWKETTITVRFWLIAGMFVALGLWVFYRGGAGALSAAWRT